MKRFAKISVAAAVACFLIGTFAGCNTTRGVGQDIEKGGAALKNSAEKHGAE